MSLIVDPSMEDLPEPVMLDILSRLPVKTIIHCKCVCKKWLNIVLDSYFADLQLSRSPACFMFEKFINKPASILKWVEVEDELNHHNFRHDPIMSLDLNLLTNLMVSQILPLGSYNGLVCLWQCGRSIDNTYICNPITREYMILPRKQFYIDPPAIISYCFGVGSLTRKYKVIQIFREKRPGLAEVYTLGTGQWRSLAHVPNYRFLELSGQFLHGHAHWSITDQESSKKICSFNFDNETFELFPSPPSEATNESPIYIRRLGVLKGCLCRCDTNYTKLTVWVMKEYGVKKSWHKELVIEKGICPNINKLVFEPARHVQRLKDGSILMLTSKNIIIVYCPRRKAIVKTELVDGYFISGVAYRPSFLRLRNFENESVLVF